MNTKTVSRTYSVINYVLQKILVVPLNSQSLILYDTFFPIQMGVGDIPKM